jgi:transposase InsO family protein
MARPPKFSSEEKLRIVLSGAARAGQHQGDGGSRRPRPGAAPFARHIAARPEFAHVRTQYRAPETNGMIERWFQSLKHEHLYRHEIPDGPALAGEVDRFLDVYNMRRLPEALDFALPIDRYLRPPAVTLEPAIQIGLCGSRP